MQKHPPPKTIAVLTKTRLGLKPSHTTACLISGLLGRGYRVLVSQASNLSVINSGRFLLHGRLLECGNHTPQEVVRKLRSDHEEERRLALVETSTLSALIARDASPGPTLAALLPRLEQTGLLILNPPAVLAAGCSRTLPLALPEALRPETLITGSELVLRAFLDDLGAPAVLKPLHGHGGEAVFHLGPGELQNLGPICEAIQGTTGGLVVAQRRIEDPAGETRALLVDGVPAGAYRRLPQGSDPRANLSRGGRPQPHSLTLAEEAALAALEPALKTADVWLAGVDMLGGKIIEVNVLAPGGVHWIRHFGGAPLEPILDTLEARLARRPAPPKTKNLSSGSFPPGHHA